MSVIICGIIPRSAAARHGILAGDRLISINGHHIDDVLDYRFYMTEELLQLVICRSGNSFPVKVKKQEYEDLGLEFDTYLMDKQRSCKNKCVFCFIDQMPAGLREPLYFKDDDSRMSFLFGNYITLTNLQDRDIQRIIQMHISPVNVSVHTTNPQLRVEMMKNPSSGKVLEYLPMLAEAGIRINAQLVLCPGINDGDELERSLRDLSALAPSLQSVASVPVGLTCHRKGLFPLRPFSREEAAAVLETVQRWGNRMLEQCGARTFFASDEFYLCAGVPLPDHAFYEEYYQLENGVGMLRLLQHEFSLALDGEHPQDLDRSVSLATGIAAAPFLQVMACKAMDAFPGLKIQVHAIANRFFGDTITVAGLVTGQDLLNQLQGCELGEELLIPSSMLRHEGDLFLDSLPVEELSHQLGLPVTPVENDGFCLLDAFLGHPPPC